MYMYCTCTYMHTCINISIWPGERIAILRYVYIHIHTRVHIYIHICTVPLHICIHTHTLALGQVRE